MSVPQLPLHVHFAAQIRALDRYAIEQCGIAGYTLMNRAAQAAFELLRETWPDARNIVVVCGAGNNGGDGYCVARLVHLAGLPARALSVYPPARLKGDALRARHECQEAGVVLRPFSVSELQGAHVIVDALFGTGIDRALNDEAAEVIRAINSSGKPVLALDLPSGLHADTGAVMGAAVRAQHTITFVGLKTGLYLGSGLELRGTLHFSDLAIPGPPAELLVPVLERLDPGILATVLRPRPPSSHKGDFGRVLVIGGGPGMPGAVRLCGEAALRSGAGLVTAATHPQNVAAIASGRPELICHGVENVSTLTPLLKAADVVVTGPGFGRDRWARSLFDAAVASDRPLVVDADALNLLAQSPTQRGNWVLTPHPGEAGRLLGIDSSDVQSGRLATVRALLERYGGVVVLKGHGTLIAGESGVPAVCDRGNPGMATAGTGDILAGMVAGMLAQFRNPVVAARVAVLVHALAGDEAAREGERGMIASDLLAHLRQWLNPPAN